MSCSRLFAIGTLLFLGILCFGGCETGRVGPQESEEEVGVAQQALCDTQGCPGSQTCCMIGTGPLVTFACANLQNSESHCGACGNACGPNQGCCGGQCKNLNTSENHCGQCNNACTGSTPDCCGGQCVDKDTDGANCGSCNNACFATQCQSAYCWNGACALHAPVVGAFCTDYDGCTTNDKCKASGACVGTPKAIENDSNFCTLDGCNPATGQPTHTPTHEGDTCPDNNACTTGTTCSAGVCGGGSPATIPNSNPCKVLACDPVTGPYLANLPNGATCAEETDCGGARTCHSGVCGAPTFVAKGTACTDDGEPCSGVEKCDGQGHCEGENVPVGAACGGDQCAPKVCSASHVCAASAESTDGNACDDGNPCSQADHCSGGRCVGTAFAGACSNGDACDGLETCSGGVCVAGTPIAVENPNTLDVCDPATGTVRHSDCQTQLDLTVTTTLAVAAKCLYVGPSPIQTGIAGQPFAETLDPLSPAAPFPPGEIAVIRGKVTRENGLELAGVRVSAPSQPESGVTFSRHDGKYDLAVRGGGTVTLSFDKPGYPNAQRQVPTTWQKSAHPEDVALVAFAAIATPVEIDFPDTQVVQGGVVSDGDGLRQATAVFPPHVVATITKPDGTTEELETLTVRATEYTVGEKGPSRMPGSLPASSAYTYALELSADEAVEAGATRIDFEEPVVFYVENFLGFPVGTPVPVGSYDRERAVWVPEPNGRVIKIVGVSSGGFAEVEGAGGIVLQDPERERLAGLYPVGTSLWRVEMTHFSPWDCNWPAGPPDDACQPGDDECPLEPTVEQPVVAACEKPGSIIECQNQTLGERVPIVGTPYTLNYRSDRVVGRTDSSTMRIPLTGDYVPPSLKSIHLEIEVAGAPTGETFECSGPDADGCEANKLVLRTWDGKDAYGREVQGVQVATIRISYEYEAVYMSPDDQARSFGAYGVALTGNRARNLVAIAGVWHLQVGSLKTSHQGLGGWSLDVQHIYDFVARAVLLGDGSRRTGTWAGSSIRTVAGGGTNFAPPNGDGGSATKATFASPSGVAVDPAGNIYVADTSHSRIRKVRPDGIVVNFAGTGQPGSGGDGGPALDAQFNAPRGLALGRDGSLYVADQQHLVRKIDPEGTVTRVAGVGSAGSTGDGGPATSAALNHPWTVAEGPDRSLYIADTDNYRIRRVSIDGTISTFAGTGVSGYSGDDGLATAAKLSEPWGVAVAEDGSVYIADKLNHRIRRVSPSGIISTVVGTGAPGFAGDGGAATSATLNQPQGVALAGDGSLYVADHAGYRLRRVGSDGRISSVAGTGTQGELVDDGGPAGGGRVNHIGQIALDSRGAVYIAELASPSERVRRIDFPFPTFTGTAGQLASEDGTQLWTLSPSGRHIKTVDALTGTSLYTFGYSADKLASVTNVDGLVTTIERDTSGDPTAIVGPYGDRTVLELDEEGYLKTIRNPAGEATKMTYYPGGLLHTFTDPRNNEHTFEYDARGLLTKDSQPLASGGWKTLSRLETTGGHDVTITTAEGVVSRFGVERSAAGEQRTTTLPNGLQSAMSRGPDGKSVSTQPDGTEITVFETGDPRFGMQAPVRSMTTTLPSGKSLSIAESRTVTLAVPGDFGSLTHLVEKWRINGNASEEFKSTYDLTAGVRTVTGTTAAGRTSVATLDQKGRVTKVQVPGLTDMDFAYDGEGRLSSVTQGARQWSRTYYEVATEARFGASATATDSLGRTTTFDSYDLARRLLGQTLPGGRTVGLGYDGSGNLTQVTPPPMTPTFGATPVSVSHGFGYSSVDQVASYNAPDVTSTEATLGETSYFYDDDGRIDHVTRPDASEVHHHYDGAGRLETLTLPLAQGELTYDYHPATGHLASIEGPVTGNLVGLVRDGGLLLERNWSGVVTGPLAVHFDYDDHLRLGCECLNGACALVNGVCTPGTPAGSFPVGFAYDLDGLMTSAGAFALTRNAQNGFVTGTSLGTIHETIDRSAFGEVEHTTARQGNPTTGPVLLQLDYVRDDLGRITQKTETVTTPGGLRTRVFDYGYDAAGRLEDVHEDTVHVAHYVYDAKGNRLRRSRPSTPGNNVDGTFDAQDRLVQYGDTSYEYTANGELKKETSPAGQTTFAYDALGNLKRVVLPGGPEIDYTVDGESHRIWKSVDGVRTQGFLWRGPLQIVAELDGAGAVVSRFVYADGSVNVPEYMVRGGVTYRILKDHLGSPRLVVNAATGAMAQRLDYDEYGRILNDPVAEGLQPLGFIPFGFAGGLYDPDTELVRFGARDYDPRTGRWTSRDPSLFRGGLNLYGYAANDPVNLVDVDGNHPALAALVVLGIYFAVTMDTHRGFDMGEPYQMGPTLLGGPAVLTAQAGLAAWLQT